MRSPSTERVASSTVTVLGQAVNTTAHRSDPLTVGEIQSAALDIVSVDGLAALSMRRLATTLNVWPTAVYHHVPDKQRLVQLVLDGALSELQLPDPDLSWRTWFEEMATSILGVLRRYPGMADHLERDGNHSRDAWVMTDVGFGVLRRAGFRDADATTFWLTAIALLCTRVRQEHVFGDAPAESAQYEGASQAIIDGADEMPNITAVAPLLFGTTPEQLTDDALALLLDGAERRLDTSIDAPEHR
ncbi:MAG: TetR/AcrR family transcriptional regulator [Actinomycetota bacterium]